MTKNSRHNPFGQPGHNYLQPAAPPVPAAGIRPDAVISPAEMRASQQISGAAGKAKIDLAEQKLMELKGLVADNEISELTAYVQRRGADTIDELQATRERPHSADAQGYIDAFTHQLTMDYMQGAKLLRDQTELAIRDIAGRPVHVEPEPRKGVLRRLLGD